MFVNADIDTGVHGRERGDGARFRQVDGLANVVAGARTGFQHAAILEFPAYLNRGRQADGVFFHHQPNGGKPLPRFQGAAADRIEVVVG
ncbi:hypothetical protein D3C86_1846650 [compost metagenome]